MKLLSWQRAESIQQHLSCTVCSCKVNGEMSPPLFDRDEFPMVLGGQLNAYIYIAVLRVKCFSPPPVYKTINEPMSVVGYLLAFVPLLRMCAIFSNSLVME